ncbi:ParB/RepB/Spo0J family partition protein [Ensifer adhaerens]|uniref:ParB/RepB/Spo0J family partition protein n=1 Tax=Ensifer adhaerens TaxID=106592 RepID=UPI00117883A0|nr:ParB/RepB/Spo0J family partition protein [Ensifer adhaerens]
MTAPIEAHSFHIAADFVLHDGEICDAVPVLIYGHHRLPALQKRGEVAVECIVYDVDDLHAELMEIDENLARSELTPAEESAYILRRQAIWMEINGKSETTCSTLPKTGRGNKQFAAEVAEVTGASKVDINRKLRRARELGDDVSAIVNTSLDSGVEMDALIKLPQDERKELIDRAASGEQKHPASVPAATSLLFHGGGHGADHPRRPAHARRNRASYHDVQRCARDGSHGLGESQTHRRRQEDRQGYVGSCRGYSAAPQGRNQSRKTRAPDKEIQ